MNIELNIFNGILVIIGLDLKRIQTNYGNILIFHRKYTFV